MRAVSEALWDGYAVNLTNHQRLLAELQLGTGLTDAEVARKLLVSPHTYRRWRRDRTPNPTAVRLLAIYSGYVPWPGWHGWEVHHGFLFPPGARHGLSPTQVEGLPWLLTLLRDQQRKSAAERPAEAPQQSGMPWWRPGRLWLALMALQPLAPVVAAVADDLRRRAARDSYRRCRLSRAASGPVAGTRYMPKIEVTDPVRCVALGHRFGTARAIPLPLQ